MRAARDLLLRAVESLDDCTPTPLPSESATVRQQSSTRRGEPPPPTAPTAQEPGPSTLVTRSKPTNEVKEEEGAYVVPRFRVLIEHYCNKAAILPGNSDSSNSWVGKEAAHAV